MDSQLHHDTVTWRTFRETNKISAWKGSKLNVLHINKHWLWGHYTSWHGKYTYHLSGCVRHQCQPTPGSQRPSDRCWHLQCAQSCSALSAEGNWVPKQLGLLHSPAAERKVWICSQKKCKDNINLFNNAFQSGWVIPHHIHWIILNDKFGRKWSWCILRYHPYLDRQRKTVESVRTAYIWAENLTQGLKDCDELPEY